MGELWKNVSVDPKERAAALLAELSLDEKLAQLKGMWGWTEVPEEQREAYEACYAAGIGHVSTLALRELRDPLQAIRFQHGLQEKIMAASPHHIPAIFHMEGLCGAFITGAMSFPAGIARGASFDPELERRIGSVVARQELAAGITEILAPVLDISRDSRMGRQGEAYGEDPTLAAAMGSAYTRGIQTTEVDGRHADACAKHFLGFHNSQGGIHGANTDAGDRLLQEIYGKPFQAAISLSELHGVMPCYNSVAGEPISSSKKYLSGLLREEMGFEGCACSDYGAVGNIHHVQGVCETSEEAGLRSLRAGMDVELPDGAVFGSPAFREQLLAAGQHSAERRALDRACLAVLTAKFRMGLFERPFALEENRFEEVFRNEEDRNVSLQSARESMVLLRNDGILPLCGGSGGKRLRLALIGPHAVNARDMFGGYTHLSMVEAVHAAVNSTAGVGASGTLGGDYLHVPGSAVQLDETDEFDELLRWIHPGCRSLAEQLREDLPDAEIRCAHGYYIAGADESGFAEALALAGWADVVLLTLGGKHGSCSVASMGEGVDGVNINLPPAQEAFILAAARFGKPMVGIHFDGRPISSDAADEKLNAILEAWSPSECGAQAISEILRGVINPSGKMPVSTAYCAGQIPIYYNHPNGSAWHQGESIGFRNYVDLPHTPRYFFGQGLSYTSFAYRDLLIRGQDDSGQEMEEGTVPEGVLRISFCLRNSGDRAGTETVQLYLRDVRASMTRPVMELAGFRRVFLLPGEEKRIAFIVRSSQLAFLDEDMRWKIEKGEILVMVGGGSEDIRLTGSCRILRDQWIAGKDRAFFAETEEQEPEWTGQRRICV